MTTMSIHLDVLRQVLTIELRPAHGRAVLVRGHGLSLATLLFALEQALRFLNAQEWSRVFGS